MLFKDIMPLLKIELI